MSLAKRLLTFSTIPAASALIPFFILPVLGRAAGENAWVAIAVGQSAGGFFALAVSLGLNVAGPTLVSLAAAADRPALFATGTRARLLIAVPAVALAAAAAALLAPGEERVAAALMAVAITLGGLSSAWYLIGLGRPIPLILFELAPRAAATALGALVIVLGGAALWYPVLLILAIAGGVGAYAATVIHPGQLLRSGWRRAVAFARDQMPAAATETVSGAYTALAVSLVSAGAGTTQAAAYVSGDKLYRMGQTVVGAQGNALQGWVVEDSRAHLRRRLRAALLLHGALGMLGLAAFAVLGPWLTGVLFGAHLALDRPTAVLFGLAILCISLTTSLGRHLLIALGRTREVFLSVVAGAVVGVPATLVLASLWGSAGGAAGLASAEAAVLAVQIVFAARAMPLLRAPSPGAGEA